MARLGLGYADIAAVHPRAIYLSVSGFGNTVPSPYDSWPAFAPIVEAMSGIYEFKRRGDDPPLVAPGRRARRHRVRRSTRVIGVLAALRHRDATGEGQHVDIAMLDAMVAMTDIVTNFWSLGLRGGATAPLIMDGFRAVRRLVHHPGRPRAAVRGAGRAGRPARAGPPTRASPTARAGSTTSTTSSVPPSRRWAADRTRLEACAAMSAAGIAAGPVLPRRRGGGRRARRRPQHARGDAPHRRRRRAGARPRQPGEAHQRGRGSRDPDPLAGRAHRRACWREELGLGDAELAALRADGTIA